MSSFAIYRGISLASLIALHAAFSRNMFLLLLSALGLGHYVMSAIYSRGTVIGYLKNTSQLVAFGMLIVLSLFLTFFEWPGLIFLFGIHHVFTEVYAPNTFYPNETLLQNKRLLFLRYFFHSFSYVLVVQAIMGNHIKVLRLEILGLALIAITYLLFLIQSKISTHTKKDIVAAEIIFLLFVAFSFWTSQGFLGLLFYHFIFWFYFPIHKIKRSGLASVRTYVLKTAGITTVIGSALYYADSQNMREYNFIRTSQSLYYLKLFSYIHIMTALALSKMNPRFIQEIFSPKNSAKLAET